MGNPESRTRQPQIHSIFIKRQYLEMILDGAKDIEVRAGYGWVKRIHPGDTLKLNEEYRAIVKDVRGYNSISNLLIHEDSKRIIPGRSAEEVAVLLGQFYPPEKVKKLGILAIEIEA